MRCSDSKGLGRFREEFARAKVCVPNAVTIRMSQITKSLVRFTSGERFRKATPREMRLFSGYFALFPISGVLFIGLGKSVLDHGGYWSIVMYVAISLVALWVAAKVWARFIPAKASWIIGGIEWALMFFLALTVRL